MMRLPALGLLLGLDSLAVGFGLGAMTPLRLRRHRLPARPERDPDAVVGQLANPREHVQLQQVLPACRGQQQGVRDDLRRPGGRMHARERRLKHLSGLTREEPGESCCKCSTRRPTAQDPQLNRSLLPSPQRSPRLVGQRSPSISTSTDCHRPPLSCMRMLLSPPTNNTTLRPTATRTLRKSFGCLGRGPGW
jgi:hypothetical protein